MKLFQSTLIGIAAFGLSASANAAVSLVGTDSTTAANWRTNASLETDNEYGTAGYVVYGLNVADSIYTDPWDISSANAGNAYSLPVGVSVSSTATTAMWSGSGNFGTIEDPTAGNAITSAPVLANGSAPKVFTIGRTSSAAFRVSLLTASGDNQGTEYTVTVNDGSGPAVSNFDHTVNGLVYHVFDVSAGTSDIVVDVVSTAENRSLTGIAFDAIPEPSSAAIIGLMSLGLILRRRRS